MLHDDRLFSSDQTQRAIARRLYAEIKELPIISPHGHTDPAWFAYDEPFPDPAALFVVPDHYLFRMLYSQGVSLEDLGIPNAEGKAPKKDPRSVWKLFAENWHLFRGTPSKMWLEHSLETVFGVTDRLNAKTADAIYDRVASCLASPEFRPRALFERFKIEVIATTESPIDPLDHHRALQKSGWKGRVVTAFRPDPVADPEYAGFTENVEQLGSLAKQNTKTWKGYLTALAERREYFKSFGATSTDHGHPKATTSDLSEAEASALFQKALSGKITADEADIFRGQILTEMVRMSLDDGLVVQIHPGSFRNHNAHLFKTYGRDKGADIPTETHYVKALKPLLDRFGNDARVTVILFTLDETSYSRELAPLAGHYPALRLGPAWWFHDSPEGMRRYREMVTETAGFYNTVGFNDDTRAFTSIPARHDVARRVDCSFLARLVAEHRLEEDEAREVAIDLAYRLAKAAYKL